MEIGDLRHRITFQKLVTTVNNSGFEENAWVDYKTVWAALSNQMCIRDRNNRTAGEKGQGVGAGQGFP